MKWEGRHLWALVAGIEVAVLLVLLTWAFSLPPAVLPLMAAFLILHVFTATFSLYVGGGKVSLLPMATVAAYLVIGVIPAGWVAYLGALLHGAIRYHLGHRLGERRPATQREAFLVTLANATIQTLGILVAASVYRLGGGRSPLLALDAAAWLRITAAGSTFLLVNHILVGAYLSVGGGERWRHYLEQIPRLLLVEGAPLIVLAPLMALIFNRLGWQPFLLFVLLLSAISLITYNLGRTHRRLQRRVGELASLQALGRTLSASLDIDTVLASVRQEVAGLMPADDFYVALYDRDNDVVSFPLAYEKGQRVRWDGRRASNGLTELVLERGEPLLIRRELEAWLAAREMTLIGRTAGCWLGVPLTAGEENLGVIAVQTMEEDVYDSSHQQVLQTIAAQAAVALQNARLYARTDEALMRRVQELRHILRTIREGILLLAPQGRILAGNRRLADFLGVTEAELSGLLDAERPDGSPSLLARVGFDAETLRTVCQKLAQEGGLHQEKITVPGPPPRPVARTLAPVYDPDDTIVGWLLVFRDLSEEEELARLRQEMTSMLVHDLRSPLSLIQGSVQQLNLIVGAETTDVAQLLEIVELNVERLLEMIDLLLEIGRLESGQGLIEREPVTVAPLLAETRRRLAPMAAQAQIEVVVEAPSSLPQIPADPAHLGRVLHNLVDNALKFTPDGGHVSLWARPANGDMLLGVSDDGPGIPAEEQAALFDKFSQVANHVGRRKGTGLGLAYCRLAVEAHGGQIWVESAEGQGSTFVVCLPLDVAKARLSTDA